MNWNCRFAQRTAHMKRSAIRELLKAGAQRDMISFAGGLPAPELFPVLETQLATEKVLRDQGKRALQMEGRGRTETFAAPYNDVWQAAVDAAQIGDLRVQHADPASGYISAGRGFRVHTWGENVGIWVKQVTPTQTQVEVVSRQAGPPRFWFKNWEDEILNSVAANLTRTARSPIIREPSGTEFRRNRELLDDEPGYIPPPY